MFRNSPTSHHNTNHSRPNSLSTARIAKPSRARTAVVLLAAAAALSMLGRSAQAANQIWTGNGVSPFNWSDANDWNGAAPGSTSATNNTDIALFNSAVANSSVTVDSPTQNIGGITFDTTAGNFVIGSTSGNSLLLSSGGTIQILSTLTSTNAIENINGPLVIEGASGTYTFANNSVNGAGGGAGTLDFGGAISGGASGNTVLTLSGSNTNANTIGGIISDGGATTLGITKNGLGTWVLTAADTYSGATTVNGGTLKLDFSAAGAPSADILYNGLTFASGKEGLTLSGGTLALTGSSGQTNSQRFNGLTLGIGPSTITLTQNGATSLTATLGAISRPSGGATLSFSVAPSTSGVIATTTNSNDGSTTNSVSGLGNGILGTWASTGSGASLSYATVNGSGQIVPFTGGTPAGTTAGISSTNGLTNYDLTAGNAGGAAGAAASVNTIRNMAGALTITPTTSLTANGIMNAGTGALTIASPLTIGANKELVIVTNSQHVTLGTILESAGGSSAVTILGDPAGTDAAPSVTLNGGTSTFTGGLNILSGVARTTGGTTSFNAANILTLGNAGTYDFNGGPVNYNFAGINDVNGGTGGQIIAGSAGSTRTAIFAGSGIYSFNGTFSNSSSTATQNSRIAVTISLTGSGVQTFGGASYFSGGLKITSGTLSIPTINSPTGPGPLGENASVTMTGGTLRYTGPTANSSTAFVVTNAPIFQVTNAAANLTLSGTFSSTGAVLKTGPGALTLSSASNSYSGVTTVENGALVAGANAPSGAVGAFGNAASAIAVGDATSINTNLSPSLLIGGAFTVVRSVTVGSSNAATSGVYTIGGNSTNAATFSGTVTLNQPTFLSQLAGGAVNFTNTISGAQPVTITGGGTVNLSFGNTYSGLTTVGNGTLQLSGSSGAINSSSGIAINGSGAKFLATSGVNVGPNITLTQGTLDGTNTVGAVTVGSGTGGIVTNGNGGTTTLTFNTLTFQGAATANLNIAGGAITNAPALTVANTLTVPSGVGAITLNLPQASLTVGSTYDLIKYGTLSGPLTAFTIGGLSPRQSESIGNDTVGKFITVTINGSDAPKWTGLDGSAWQVGSTGMNSNWQLISAGTPTNYIEGDVVLFDDSATGEAMPGAVAINGANVSPTSTTFNNSTTGISSYTLSGDHGIAGTGGLTKLGNGQLNIANSNSYTGATTINAGTMNLTGTLGSGAGTAITTAATFTESSTGVIAGGSTLRVTGGTTTLAGVNTYTGGTTLNGGILNINSSSTLGSNSAPLTLSGGVLQYAPNSTNADISTRLVTFGSGGATIDLNGNNVSYAGPIGNGGSGVFTIANTVSIASLTLSSNASTYSGGTIVNSGVTLALGASSSGSPVSSGPVGKGSVTINLGGTLQINDGPFTVQNAIVSSGGTSGTATIQNVTSSTTTNTLSGAITLSNPLTAISSATSTTGLLVLSGGVSGPPSNNNAFTLTLDGTNVGNIISAAGLNYLQSSYSGVIAGGNGSGIVAIVKQGLGGWELTNNSNSYSGGTSINAGSIQITQPKALGSGPVNIAAGGQLAFDFASQTVTNDITLNGNTTTNGFTGALVGQNLNAGGTNILSGKLTLAGGVFSNVSTGLNNKFLNLTGLVTGSALTGNGGLQLDLYRAGGSGPNVTLSNPANDYQLGTLVTSGILQAGASSVTGGSGASMTITSGPTGTGLLTLTPTNNSTPTLDVNAFNLAVGGLSGTGGIVGSSSTGTPGALTIVTGATPQTFSGAIANSVTFNGVVGTQAVSVNIAGSGMQTLAGTNTYTGATAITSGTLNLTGTLGGGVGGGTAITSAAAFSQSSTGVIAGGSTLTVTAGTTTLAGTNTYTGATAINGGTLQLSGSGAIAASPTITVNSGGVFDVSARTGGTSTLANMQTIAGTGSVTGGLVLPSGASISPGVNAGVTNVGTLTTGDLTLNSGAILNTYFGTPGTMASPGVSGLVQVNGNLTLPAGGVNVNLINNFGANSNGAIEAGVYDIMNFTGTLIGFAPGLSAVGTFTVTSTPLASRVYTFSQSGNSILLNVSTSVVALTWTGAAGTVANSVWDTMANNWANGASPSAYTDPDSATFNDTSAVDGSPIVNSNITIQAGGVFPANVAFNNSNVNYTLRNSGSDTVGIGGSAGITKTGTGTLTLQSPNTFGGPVAINAGAVSISNGGALGTPSSLSLVTVSSGATLRLSGGISTPSGIPATISGAGLAAAPAGAITNVSGTNTFAGAIALGAPSTITASADTLNLTGGIATAGYALTLNGPGAISIGPGAVSGTGSLAYSGSGVLALSDGHTYSGGTTIASGTVIVGGDAALGAPGTNLTFAGNGTLRTGVDTNQNHTVVINSGVTATIDTNTHNATINSVTGSGSTGLVKAGGGTLTLGGANTYTGTTRVIGGVLQLSPQVPIAAVVQVDATKSSGSSVTTVSNYGSQGGAFAGSAGLVAGAINGHQAFFFNNNNPSVPGVNQFLASTTAYTNAGNTVTTFIVENPILTAVNNGPELSFIGPGGNVDFASPGNMLVETNAAATTIHVVSDGISLGDITRPALNTPLIFDSTINTGTTPRTAASDLIVNNAGAPGLTSSTGTPNAVAFNINTMAIGGRYNGSTTPFGTFNGDIGEVLMYNAALTPAQVASVEAYLQAKWLGIGTGTGNLPTTTPLQIGSGAALDLAGLNQQVASLSDISGAGGTVTSSAAGSIALTLAPTATTTFSGVIQDGSGVVSLVVNGSGTQILAGANSYSGTTTITAGTLQIGNGGAAGALGGGAVTNNGALVFNRNDSALVVAGAIGGNGTLTQAGIGTTTLSGINTYIGATIINAGTLAVNGSTGAASTVTVGDTGTLAGIGTVGGPVSLTGGTTGSTIASSGTLTLGSTLGVSGANNQLASGTVAVAGATTIGSGGSLAVNGTLGGTGSVTVAGTLRGTGTITSPVTIGNAGTLIAPTAATLTLSGGLTLDTTGSSSTFTLGTPNNTSNPFVSTSSAAGNSIVANGAHTINIAGSPVVGTYDLFSYTGGVTGFGNFALGLQPGPYVYALVNNIAGNQIDLSVTNPTSSSTWNLNSGDVYGNAADWSPTNVPNAPGLAATFGNGDTQTVNVGSLSVVVDGAYALGSMKFLNTNGTNYILGSGGASTGLTLNNNGQANGGFTGAVVTVNAAATGGNPHPITTIYANLTLADNTTFNVAPGNTLLLSSSGGPATFGGTGNVTLTGGGAMTVDRTGAYLGNTTVSNATLTVSATGNISSAGSLVADGASGSVSLVNLNNSQTVRGLSGSVSGGGSSRVNVAAATTLTVNQTSGTSTYAGTLNLVAGTVTPATGGALGKLGSGAEILTGAVQLNNSTVLNVSGGTLRVNASSGTVGTGVTANVTSTGTLELAGAYSALGTTTPANRTAIVNNSTAAAGVLVSSGNQQVGGIDGAGNVQVAPPTGMIDSLTADHITAGALVIGGDATSSAVVTIAASNPDGTPMASSGFALASSLTPSAPFASGALSSSSVLAAGGSSDGNSSLGGSALGSLNLGGNVAAVPEPSTVLLLLGSLAILLPVVWRRASRSQALPGNALPARLRLDITAR